MHSPLSIVCNKLYFIKSKEKCQIMQKNSSKEFYNMQKEK